MTKIKLLIFIGSLSIGGGQQVVAQLIKSIDQEKADVTLICYEGRANTLIEKEIEDKCNVVYLNANGSVTIGKILTIFREITKHDPDIVHVHLGGMAYAVPWALLHRIPLLITAHTKPDQAFVSKVLPLIKFGIKKRWIRIAAVSRENLLLTREYFKIDDERITCVNNGICLDKYYTKDHSVFTFINVSRQDDNKNQELIIRSFYIIHQRYANTKLILVGDGPTHGQLMKLTKELQIEESVDFTGIVSNPEAYYSISDVYVQSSHREAMPMSILEALATRMPIISTNVGGIKDAVNENGILIDDSSEEQMITAMKHMLSIQKTDEFRRMQDASWKIVQDYSAQSMASKYLEIYEEMLRQND